MAKTLEPWNLLTATWQHILINFLRLCVHNAVVYRQILRRYVVLSAANNIDIWNFEWRFILWMNNTIMSVHLFGLVNTLPMYIINLVFLWPKWIGANLALINFYGLRMLYYLWEQKSPTLNLWCTIISQMYHNKKLSCCKYLITTAQYPFS